jgi:PPOX class probable F420-dependent enzyme
LAYRAMSEAELVDFLHAVPARTAKLATVRADGTAHVAPVWVDVEPDGAIVFMTGAGTVKGRNLARTRRAAMCFDDEQPPFSFASLEGPVELVDVGPDELLDYSIRIAGRYMGADRAQAYGRRNAVPGELLVRLRPERVASAADLAD